MARGKGEKFNQIEYVAEYNKKNYDSVSVRFPKGKKEEIREEARKRGMSLNQFITFCVSCVMESGERS